LEQLFQTLKNVSGALAAKVGIFPPSIFGSNELTSFGCWYNFVKQRETALLGYIQDGTIPEESSLGDVNFCILLFDRAVGLKFQASFYPNSCVDDGSGKLY
jgi:hypothetical protein